jgi:hypothetical protein
MVDARLRIAVNGRMLSRLMHQMGDGTVSLQPSCRGIVKLYQKQQRLLVIARRAATKQSSYSLCLDMDASLRSQ